MAGSFTELYSQEFTSTSTITVTHNLDRVICAVRVIVGGGVRNDIVQSVVPSESDPRNEIIVTLGSANTGLLQVVDSDYIWASLPTPEGASALENNISGSTFSGSFTGSFSGDGSAISNVSTQVNGSNILWVDASGSDVTGTRERFGRPYASIGGALSSASAGDVVVVRPGTYEESITMVAGVSVVGMDRDRCILKNYSGGFAVEMANNCAFEHMSVDISSSSGVRFTGTSGGTSAIRHARITSVGGNATGVHIMGTPAPAENWITCDHVDAVGTGLSNAFLHNSAGTVNLRDCFGYALVGLQVASTSTTRAQDCRFSGFSGLYITDSTSTLYMDQSTRWSSLVNAGGGTLVSDLIHLLRSSGNNTELQLNSNGYLSSSADLTFDGSLLAVTGTLSIDGNANANRFDGLFVGDLTGEVTGNVLGNVTGDLVGTSSFADEAAKVSNVLSQGTGITAFSYDGSSAATVAIDNTVVTLTGVQTLSNKIVSGTFSGSFIGDGTALSITETDTLDDVTGRGNTTTNSITVNGITSNSNIILTGALNATGDIDNAGTYNGIQHYTSSATDPTTPTPSDGDRYYNTALDMEMRYDNTRSKWLSVEASVMEFGRGGNTGGGSYYRGPGNRAYASDKGRTAEFDGTVVSVSYTRNDTDSATFEVTANGTGIATLASSAGTGKDVTLNGDFTADQILGVKNQTGSNSTRHVLGWVRIRWRA